MKKAIVLSAFGSAEIEALQPFLDIAQDVATTFPMCELRLAFTSPTIRGIWRKRAEDQKFRAEYPQLPHFFYNAQTPLSVLADLQDKGYKQIVVQPLYMVQGAEFYDLRVTVDALRSIATFRAKNTPFPNLALGRPFLGINSDTRDYHQDIKAMALALEDDILQADKRKRALVYIGHGNRYHAMSFFSELEASMRAMTEIPVFFATLAGWPNIPSLIPRLQAAKIKNILLKPFLFTSGKHSHQDIAGKEAEGWLPVLHDSGLDVQMDFEPLGSRPQLRRILVQHIRDAATDAGIDL